MTLLSCFRYHPFYQEVSVMRKVLCILMVCILFLLTGCSGNTGNQGGKSGPVTITIWHDKEDAVIAVLQEAVKEATAEEAVLGVMTAWTDGALLARYANIPTVILGPDGENAHAHDEYIPVDQLSKTALIYALAAVDFCRS